MAMIDVMDLKQGDQIISVRAFRPEVGWEGDPYVSPTRIFLSGTKLSFDSCTVHRGAEEPYSTMVQFVSDDNIRYRAPAIYFIPFETLEGFMEMTRTGKIEPEKDEEPILDPVCKTGASIILYGLASVVAVGLVSLVLGLASNFF